jgi:hypothetical protein
MRVLLIVVLVVVGLPAMMYLIWQIHCTLDRVCVRHARRFCKQHGLEISRVRWQMEFERRADGSRGVKTEFTLVQLDCLDGQKQRRLVLLRVWPLGVRKLLSDEKYPELMTVSGPKMRLTPRWSQRRPPLEFMDGLSYTTVMEIAEPPARRRGSALDR